MAQGIRREEGWTCAVFIVRFVVWDRRWSVCASSYECPGCQCLKEKKVDQMPIDLSSLNQFFASIAPISYSNHLFSINLHSIFQEGGKEKKDGISPFRLILHAFTCQ